MTVDDFHDPYAALRLGRAALPQVAHAGAVASTTPAAKRQASVARSAPLPQASADMAGAACAARLAEQSRWMRVFAADASRGRERTCARLLADEAGWDAASILAELPNLPTDAQLAADRRRHKLDRDAQPWGRAYPRLRERRA